MSILPLPLMIEIVQISVKDNIHLLLLLSELFITHSKLYGYLKLSGKYKNNISHNKHFYSKNCILAINFNN